MMNGFQEANKNKEANLEELDESQREAVISDAKKVVIRAPAGSGKTKSLIAAITNHRWNYINDRICAITYTRAARAEMQERLRQNGIYDVEVTTIHVWSRNLLEDLASKYDFKIDIMEEARIKTILSAIVKQYLVYSKVKSININILYSYITGNKNMDITDNYKRTLNALEARYVEYKRENNLYDFTDYPLYLYDVMTTYDEFVTTIDALFVDEFQDVDPTQLKIFDRVLDAKKMYIGDSWQSIYIFRSADGEVFNKLPDFETYELKHNYRSYQEIIDFATTFYKNSSSKLEMGYGDILITDTKDREVSSVMCRRGYGGTVTVIDSYADVYKMTGENNLEEFDSGEKFIYNLLEQNAMILCRTNKQVKEIQDFGYTNVSTVHQAKGLEYQKVIVIDFAINDVENTNVAYVALTRAKDELCVITWQLFENWIIRWKSRKNLA